MWLILYIILLNYCVPVHICKKQNSKLWKKMSVLCKNGMHVYFFFRFSFFFPKRKEGNYKEKPLTQLTSNWSKPIALAANSEREFGKNYLSSFWVQWTREVGIHQAHIYSPLSISYLFLSCTASTPVACCICQTCQNFF